jgi:hypothetical protein
MRKFGHRLPCRICGASRDGQPQNSARVAVCKDCWPEYLRSHARSHFVTVYMPTELKVKLDLVAFDKGISPTHFVRQLIKSAIS